MSKSSSGGQDGSRSSSVECDETNNQQQQQQQQQQQSMNIQALMNSNSISDNNGSSLLSEENILSMRNEPIVPNSPPPSYEHVLEETRMAVVQSATNTDDDIRSENCTERQKISDGGTDRGGRTPIKGPEILHKSSKELYRAVAKQWGITCKMSDQCRCFDCQSHYFDCEYEKDEQEKTDGGLGAGTPMFLSEVIHGTACTII